MNVIAHTLPLGFIYTPEIVYPDGRVVSGPPVCNIIPQAGVDHIASMIQGSGTPLSTWAVGIFEGNYVPTSSFTSADLQTLAQECVAYTEATRPLWSDTYDGVGVIDNLASRAEFTMNANKTIYGAFLVSNSTKGGNTGLTQSIARFASPQVLVSGAVFRVAVGLTLVPTNLI